SKTTIPGFRKPACTGLSSRFGCMPTGVALTTMPGSKLCRAAHSPALPCTRPLDLLPLSLLDRHVPPQALERRLVVRVEGVETVGPLDQRVRGRGLAHSLVRGHTEAARRRLLAG